MLIAMAASTETAAGSTTTTSGFPDRKAPAPGESERAPVGVLLVNLGSPASPEVADVRTFLREFLSDPQVVEANRVLWWLVLNAIVLPYKIVQTPSLVLVLYEENTVFRQIFLDGRKPVANPVPRWMGYSTGRWEGDELVVETVGVTDQSWLDGMGHPHTDRMRVTERFRRRAAGHLEIQTVIDDPGAYTQPFTYTVKATLVPEDDLLEYFCTENEKDAEHYR